MADKERSEPTRQTGSSQEIGLLRTGTLKRTELESNLSSARPTTSSATLVRRTQRYLIGWQVAAG